MPKQQTGLRVDRLLFKQFQQLCAMEKLRPGEAAELLIRAALEAKSIAGFGLEQAKKENTARMFDDALFRSRLTRLKTALELEKKLWKETGEEEDEESKESEYWIDQLTELGRRNVSPELVGEFETCMSESDQFYEETLRFATDEKICSHKALIKD